MAQGGLEWSIEMGDMKAFESAVQTMKDINEDLGNGRRAIHVAADFGQADMLAKLIKAGADVDIKDDYGITPLMVAVYENNTECVKVLLNNKAHITEGIHGQKLCECTESQEIKQMLRK